MSAPALHPVKMIGSPSLTSGGGVTSPLASHPADLVFSDSAIQELTNINDINRHLHETVAKERSIDAELEQLLTRRQELEKSMVFLHASTSEVLEVVQADAEQLHSSVQSTSDLAERVSKKVRELDLAQSRVQDTLRRINMVVDRSNCIDGVRDALSCGDLERAADHVAGFLGLEEECGEMGDADNLQAQEQKQVLEEARQSLEEVVKQRFAEAARKQDHAALLRHLKIFKPLRLEEAGLSQFTEYVRSLVAERSKADYDRLVDSLGGDADAAPNFADALANLLKTTLAAVEEHEDLLRSTFGAEAFASCALAWHAQCDADAGKILQRYAAYRQLTRLAKDIGSAAARGPSGGGAAGGRAGDGSGVDPRMVEGYLDELLLLCQSSEEYLQIMSSRLQDQAVSAAILASSSSTGGAATGNNNNNPTSPSTGAVSPTAAGGAAAAGGGGGGQGGGRGGGGPADAVLRGGAMNGAVRELVSYYISLEEYYMEESVGKAIRIDEYSPDCLTSSMVDDVFFILQKCSRRALASGRVMSIAAVFSHSNILLSSAYKDALATKLQGAAARLLQSASPDGQDPGSTPTPSAASGQYVAPFNNADVSAGYVLKLRQQLEELVAQTFNAPAERDKIKSVLADLGKTSRDFSSLTTKALDQLCGGIMPRLRHVLDEVSSVSYELSENEYASNEVADTWVQQLLGALGGAITWLQHLLTPNNYDTLFHLALDKVVSRLEAVMLSKRFNQLGGLQLDRDVRVLVAQLSETTQRTVRDKFARLNQMATVLGLESAREILDYWGDNSGPITWRLTEVDVRQVLSQRTDFSRQEIAALPL